MTLAGAGTQIALTPKITAGYLIGGVWRALLHPSALIAKLRYVFRVVRENRAAEATATVAAPVARPAPLGLVAGERVRVKSKPEILATLDAENRCERLSYMPVVMDRFCGREFRVRTRVDRFFDERNWRMMKLKNVVLLDEVVCEPPPDADISWAGCQRSCLLFWKEAWLERVDRPT
jgi:hypothetical protein